LFLMLELFLPLWAAVVTITTYPVNERFLSRLIQVYLAVLVLFANAYLIVASLYTPRPPIAGIPSLCVQSESDPARSVLDPGRVLRAAVDSFHLSCITITTVGYGDITPSAWYAKLLTDLE